MGKRYIVWAFVLLCSACPESPIPVDQEQHPDSSDELYTRDRVWHIDLQLSDSQYKALDREPRTYVIGDIRIGDTTIHDVGIRLKGTFSFQGLGGKAAFKVKFNKFADGQRYLGLEKLSLNNLRQDRSLIHEWLGYQVFRAAGIPAPRSGFARVSINGEVYGLYANVEVIDDRFLTANFEDGNGNLYEAPWGADLDRESVEKFEQDEGDDTSRADLDVLVTRVAQPGDGVFFDLDAPIDTSQFLRFVASEALIGHWDGYWKSNNYFLYHEVAREKWSFLPWGLDQSFDRTLHPFTSAGELAEKCFAFDTCMSEYSRLGLEVVSDFEGLQLQDGIDEIGTLIEAYADEDPRSPHPIEKVERFQEIVRADVSALPERIREVFRCMEDGVEQDRDEDGYGACTADCNDKSPLAHPGRAEECDELDNDCDGYVDEVACPCSEVDLEGEAYLFCEALVPWTRARDECIERGGALAILGDEETSNAAFTHATGIAPTRSWYLGGNDRDEEGAWKSSTGDDLGFHNFAPGEPDDFGGEHCTVLASFAGGQWADLKCNTALPYICETSP